MRSIREVSGTDGGAPPRRPVLPPLPADLAPDADLDLVPSDLHSTPYSGPPDPGIALGVADFPDRQEQRLLCWAPSRHSHLALLGLPGSGAAEAAEAVVGALIHERPDSHLYLLDGDGSLAQHRGAPQLGALVQHSEPGRAARVLERLAGLPPRTGEDAREIILVVTGWGRWATRFRGGRFARAEEDLHSLVRDGAQTGVSVLVTGDREVTGARFFALLPNRVYLPRGAHPETTMTWPRMPVLDPVPGRGYVQGRIAGPPGEGVCQLILRRSTAAVATRPPSVLPFPVLPLPHHLPLLELQRMLDAARVRGSARDPGPGLLLGVHGDDLLPYSVDLPPGEVHLVLGPPGSGRSNVLRVLARAADRISPRRRVLAPPGEAAGVERADFWRALPRGAGPSSDAQQYLLLVDDADRLPADVQQILSGLVAHGAAAVLVAFPGPTLTSRVPLALQARASGRGLILMPRSAADGDILGHRPETDAGASPGRGVACGPEGAVEIQVAFASHPPPAPESPTDPTPLGRT